MSVKTIVLIGAGNRGTAYTTLAHKLPEKFKVVAVAEPIEIRREYIKNLHGVDEANCFHTWEDVFKREKLADVAMICTQDKDHIAPALAAIEAGYDILLEKPMSITPEDCAAISAAAEKKGVKVVICFVLRYSSFFMSLKKLILEDKIGRIMNIDHIEGVGNVHQSHSFVRGNWHSSLESCPMILAKSSHDIDILQWLIGSKCKKVQSFGSLQHFTKENKPEGAPARCIDGCPHANTCYYNSVEWYLNKKDNAWFRTVATNTSENPSDELVIKALHETDYGKCVYDCDNDVVDHQSVNLLYENGVTATFTMSAFNEGGREIRIMGTKGELRGSPEKNYISYYSFATRKWEDINYTETVSNQDITGGHGGGDSGIVNDLYEYLGEDYKGFSMTPISVSADNHITAFAAEFSRTHGGITVDMDEFKKTLLK